jgi:hypothetical protein
MSRSTKILFLTNVLCVSSVLMFQLRFALVCVIKVCHQQFWIQHGKPPSVVLARKSVTEIRIGILVSAQPNKTPTFWTAPRSVHQTGARHPQRWHAVHCYTRNDEFEFCLRLTSSAFIFCFALSSVIQLFYFVWISLQLIKQAWNVNLTMV